LNRREKLLGRVRTDCHFLRRTLAFLTFAFAKALVLRENLRLSSRVMKNFTFSENFTFSRKSSPPEKNKRWKYAEKK
jgi:hypothetical protein